MKTLRDPRQRSEIISRLRRITPDSRRRWGRMDPHQMLCHLDDSFRCTMGGKEVRDVSNRFTRTVLRWFALQFPLRWPPYFPTRPEIDQRRGGTPPTALEADRERLIEAVGRFCRVPRDFQWTPHPYFGVMSDEDYWRWGWLHADHHLRQFSQ